MASARLGDRHDRERRRGIRLAETSRSTPPSAPAVYRLHVNGVASGTTVDDGGGEVLLSGGLADDTVIDSGGYQSVNSSNLASATTVNSGGAEFINANGVADFTTVGPAARDHLQRRRRQRAATRQWRRAGAVARRDGPRSEPSGGRRNHQCGRARYFERFSGVGDRRHRLRPDDIDRRRHLCVRRRSHPIGHDRGRQRFHLLRQLRALHDGRRQRTPVHQFRRDGNRHCRQPQRSRVRSLRAAWPASRRSEAAATRASPGARRSRPRSGPAARCSTMAAR